MITDKQRAQIIEVCAKVVAEGPTHDGQRRLWGALTAKAVSLIDGAVDSPEVRHAVNDEVIRLVPPRDLQTVLREQFGRVR